MTAAERWKLTNEDYRTHGDCQWGPGITHEVSGDGNLCGPGWIHVYTSPRLAVLLNPIHAAIESPVLWRVECDGQHKADHGLKEGWTRVTTVEIVEAPVYSREQHVAFGIWCAAAVCVDPQWCAWADGWISGRDRSRARAATAARAAAAATAARAARAAAGAAGAAGTTTIDFDAIALRALEWTP